MQIHKWGGLNTGTYSTGQDGTVSIATDCRLVGPDDQILVGGEILHVMQNGPENFPACSRICTGFLWK